MADMIATVGRPPMQVIFGENTAESMRQAGLAVQAATAAEESAAYAEEFSGPAYATVGAGEAATASGQFFRVPIAATDPVEYTRYQRTSGGSVEAAALATTASLAASTGSELVGFSHAESYGDGSVGQRLQQEIWVTDAPYNADPTGANDASAAFQAAIAALAARGGGDLRAVGRFIFEDTVTLPAEPNIVNIKGGGFNACTFVQGTADTPIITKVAGVSRIVGVELSGFTVEAHPASDKADPANILIDITGFDDCRFSVEYKSAAGATSSVGCVYAVIAGHADGVPCYMNDIYLKMHQTPGPERGVWLHNGGSGTSLTNANSNRVRMWVYGMTDLGIAADVLDTTQTTVWFSLFEDSDGTSVKAGNNTVTFRNWFELMDVAIDYGTSSDTTANNCISISDQFSGANKIVIHTEVLGPPRFNDPLLGTITFHNQAAAVTTNYVMPTLSRVQPAVPTIAWLIIGATTNIDATAVRLRPDHHGVVTTMATYSVTPLGTGRDALAITPPAGYEIMNATVGIEEITLLGVGVAVRPVAMSADPAGKNYVVYWPNTNNHQVNVRVTMRAV